MFIKRNEFIYLILLIIIPGNTCLIRLFFTWRLNNNILSLICKVDELVYDVMILDANSKEQAACLIPSKEHECFTYLAHAHTDQNLQTNTTTMKIHIDELGSSLNGNWTCLHGRYEKADTEINILSSSDISSLNTFSLWTLIGYFSSLMVIHSFMSLKSRHGIDYCSTFSTYLQTNKRRRIILLQWFSCMLIIVYLAALPVYLSVKASAIFPKLFLADGVILGILSYIFIKVCNLSDKNSENQIIEPERITLSTHTSKEVDENTSSDLENNRNSPHNFSNEEAINRMPSVESIEPSSEPSPLLTSNPITVNTAFSNNNSDMVTLSMGLVSDYSYLKNLDKYSVKINLP